MLGRGVNNNTTVGDKIAVAKKLTPEILAGTAQTDEYTFDMDGEQFTVTIRPLTVGERIQVESMAQRAMKLRGGGKDGGAQAQLDEVMKARAESEIHTVTLGVVEPKLTRSDIVKSTLPCTDIADGIKKLSGMKTRAEEEADDEDEPAQKYTEGAEFRSE